MAAALAARAGRRPEPSGATRTDVLKPVFHGAAQHRDETWPGVRLYLGERRHRSTRPMTKGPGMRRVVLQMGVTLDGFVHGAKGYKDWGLPPEDDEVVAWKVASLHVYRPSEANR
jgi:hypothetical protein